MYTINKYCFKEFRISPGHRANYAILCNPEFAQNQWGLKYHPSNDYAMEYKVLALFSHPQIPVRFGEGKDVLYKDGKFVLSQSYIAMSHFEGEDVVEYYKKLGMPDQAQIKLAIQHFASVTLPLHHIHAKKHIHSDIKPGHLILNPATGTMGLIDLECAIKEGEIIRGMSKEYASPEQKEMIRLLRSGEDDRTVLKKVQIRATSDLYSVGLLFYQALTGKQWQSANVAPQEINKAIPDKLNRIVLGLLEEAPGNRIPSAEALKAELDAI